MRKEKRTRKLAVRLTEGEYNWLELAYKKTTSPQLSSYVRSLLLKKPVVVKYRSESLDGFMEEIILLRQELHAIGNNYNQAVRKLHTLHQIPEFRNWISGNEKIRDELIEKTQRIQERIDQISRKWLQE